ncbi:MAG: purine-nucleoside phosphorylase [Patescibacteria group bacterium]
MNIECRSAAISAAQFIRKKCNCHIVGNKRGERAPIGLILGTGWGNALDIEIQATINFKNIPGFKTLGQLAGHERKVIIGNYAGRQLIILSGRVHLNEAPADPEIYRMVRLQTEMLFLLGVKEIIVTSASGGLCRSSGASLRVGDVAVIDGFVTLYAPDMPLWAGEFYSPEDAINEDLNKIVLNYRNKNLKCLPAGYAMVRGPQFEGRKYDKALLAKSGAGVVGMSTLPEACIANIYDAKFLGLSFVTNSDSETHSHEENLRRAGAASENLGNLLEHIIYHM